MREPLLSRAADHMVELPPEEEEEVPTGAGCIGGGADDDDDEDELELGIRLAIDDIQGEGSDS
jgi:hypothetical protein